MRILVALCLSLFVLCVTAPRVSAENGHGCATANAANPSPTAQPGTTPPTEAGALVINEILFNPATQWNCSDAAPSPNRWIEIYNPGASSFILTTSSDEISVITAIDSGPGTQSYYIPDGTTIAAHGFLIVFPDHPTFFYAEMPMLRLLVNGVVVNEVTPLPQFGPDTSFARKPDGGDSWESTAVATINSTNVPHLTPTLTPTPLPTRTPGITPTPQITPKVTPTPKPTITPTPTLVATPTSIVTPASTSPPGTSTTPAISTTSQSQIIDNQPTWEELHMPDLTPTGKSSPQTTTPSINSPSPTTLSPPGETGLMELIRKIAMSIVATALASVLFWCWKLFDTG